jgi:ArsR family transcriptional regulator, arsenate/arsenite/antimonite-responsive transcriptional repressor
MHAARLDLVTSEPQTLTPAGCCNALTGGALEPAEAERLARVFKALGDRTRVRLLSIIAVQENAEACVCDLTGPVGLSQPTVSHHLKQLVEVGLLTREQRGRWSYYRLVDEALDAVSAALGRDALSRRSC